MYAHHTAWLEHTIITGNGNTYFTTLSYASYYTGEFHSHLNSTLLSCTRQNPLMRQHYL